MPAELFNITGHAVQNSISIEPTGVRIVPESRETYTANRFEYRTPIYGDFDATLAFDDLHFDYGGRGVIGIELDAIDDTGILVASARLHREKNRISATAKMSIPLPDDTRRYVTTHVADESTQGTLRLVRRGLPRDAGASSARHGSSQSGPGEPRRLHRPWCM